MGLMLYSGRFSRSSVWYAGVICRHSSRERYAVKKLLFFTVLVLALVACRPETLDPPTIRLESPTNELRVAQGERLLVQSVAQGDQLAKTELWVDGHLYEVARPDDGGHEFAAIQPPGSGEPGRTG
jgi:hypothetical protein